ncbi:hypothetical protein IKW72_04350 [bacterium]|nr:hypothetical protein [bacterium]
MKNIILLVLLSITLAVKAAYADYASLLYKASAFESIIALDKDNADKYDELKAASVQLSSVPVSEALPELMSLFERKVITNRLERIGDITITNYAVGYAYKKAFLLTGLTFGFNSYGHIAFPWLTGKGQLMTIPSTMYSFFWWYEGRRYVEQIWNAWYACWQTECGRENPRSLVKKTLADEICGLGYYVFPFLYQNLENDKSLNEIVSMFNEPSHGNWGFKNFSEWYSINSNRFVLPTVETISVAGKRFEISNLPVSKMTLDSMQAWEKAASDFYRSNNISSNYWYNKIQNKNIISEEDIFQAKFAR